MSQIDFSHAQDELSGKPWVANLAGGLAAAASALALASVLVAGRVYIQPLVAEQGVVLPKFTQFVWQTSGALFGVAGLAVGFALALACFVLWRRARKHGGASTAALFGLAGLAAAVAVVAVVAGATPVHDAQDRAQDRAQDPAAGEPESGR